MKALNEFFTEQRSVMTNFCPLTAEAVASSTKDGLTWSELNACLIQHGLDISFAVHDPTRKIFNTYYADFDRRLYGHIPLNRRALHDGIPLFIAAARSEDEIAPELTAKDWRVFYSKRVPLPMYLYDFQRRYRDIQPEAVFSVWYDIYGMTGDSIERWPPEILDYIFSKVPVPKLPELDKDGLITIYRGMEKITDVLKSVIIWDTSSQRALFTATHLNIDINIAEAHVRPEQVVAYGFGYTKDEVIVRPGAVTEWEEFRL